MRPTRRPMKGRPYRPFAPGTPGRTNFATQPARSSLRPMVAPRAATTRSTRANLSPTRPRPKPVKRSRAFPDPRRDPRAPRHRRGPPRSRARRRPQRYPTKAATSAMSPHVVGRRSGSSGREGVGALKRCGPKLLETAVIAFDASRVVRVSFGALSVGACCLGRVGVKVIGGCEVFLADGSAFI